MAGIEQDEPSQKLKQINTTHDNEGQNKTRFGGFRDRRVGVPVPAKRRPTPPTPPGVTVLHANFCRGC
jgi:hypothetical protein